jgi:hypothetical protein
LLLSSSSSSSSSLSSSSAPLNETVSNGDSNAHTLQENRSPSPLSTESNSNNGNSHHSQSSTTIYSKQQRQQQRRLRKKFHSLMDEIQVGWHDLHFATQFHHCVVVGDRSLAELLLLTNGEATTLDGSGGQTSVWSGCSRVSDNKLFSRSSMESASLVLHNEWRTNHKTSWFSKRYVRQSQMTFSSYLIGSSFTFTTHTTVTIIVSHRVTFCPPL